MHITPNKVVSFPNFEIPKKLSSNLLGEHGPVQTSSNISRWKRMVRHFLHGSWSLSLSSQPFSHRYHGRHKGHGWQSKGQQIMMTVITVVVAGTDEFLNLRSNSFLSCPLSSGSTLLVLPAVNMLPSTSPPSNWPLLMYCRWGQWINRSNSNYTWNLCKVQRIKA